MSARLLLVLGVALLLVVPLADAAPHRKRVTADCSGNDVGGAPGRVVLSFDDGWRSQYSNAIPLLQARNLCATFYVISGQLRTSGAWGDRMSASEVLAISNAGQDIESHTVDHVDLTTLSVAAMDAQLAESKSAIQTLTGKPVVSLAYPYGAFNTQVKTETAKWYHDGRNYLTDPSQDSMTVTDRYAWPALGTLRTTSVATVEGWIDDASAHGRTLVLVFHSITTSPGTYDWTPSQLAAVLDYTTQKGVPITTMREVATGSP